VEHELQDTQPICLWWQNTSMDHHFFEHAEPVRHHRVYWHVGRSDSRSVCLGRGDSRTIWACSLQAVRSWLGDPCSSMVGPKQHLGACCDI
jgi:hypothetical protein